MTTVYIVHKGVTVGGAFFPPGAVIESLPEGTDAWLIECGAIEVIEAAEPQPKRRGRPRKGA